MYYIMCPPVFHDFYEIFLRFVLTIKNEVTALIAS